MYSIEEEIRIYFEDLKDLKVDIKKGEKHLIQTIKEIVKDLEED